MPNNKITFLQIQRINLQFKTEKIMATQKADRPLLTSISKLNGQKVVFLVVLYLAPFVTD